MNALKMFESSARHLNFRLAADEIGLTQGAVAQQVRGLEEFLGAKLFNRLPRGLELTEAGRRYLKPVQRALTPDIGSDGPTNTVQDHPDDQCYTVVRCQMAGSTPPQNCGG